MILQADPLIGGSAPQKDRADNVQHVLLQHDALVTIDVGIGEIDRQRRVIIAQIRSEQQRLDAVQHQFKPREIAGVGVEQTIGPAGGGADVAVTVQHDEGVVMLECAARPCRGPGHRNVERRFLDDFDLANSALSHSFD